MHFPFLGLRLGVLALCCFLVLGQRAYALDPHKQITQYVHDAWKTNDGLPQNASQALLQTRDGYLWVGTEEGLSRFDGSRFKVFNSQNTAGIKSNFILALFED